jgi:hypothetical protein
MVSDWIRIRDTVKSKQSGVHLGLGIVLGPLPSAMVIFGLWFRVRAMTRSCFINRDRARASFSYG